MEVIFYLVAQKPTVYNVREDADNPDEQRVVNNLAENYRLRAGKLVVIPKSVFALIIKAFACGIYGSKNEDNPKQRVPRSNILDVVKDEVADINGGNHVKQN